MTFSLIFADPAGGVVGGGVQSHYPFVGATVLRARAGVGASVSQGVGSAALADELLGRLDGGEPPVDAMRAVVSGCVNPDSRQLAVIGSTGLKAVHTGAHCIAFAAESLNPGFLAVGNMLSQPDTLQAMATTFRRSFSSPPAERVAQALLAADRAGGDVRGKQSAALVIKYESSDWRDIDVRVDDAAEPLSELSRLIELRRRYEVLDDPAVKAGTSALDHAVRLAIEEEWPEEVRFWLIVLLEKMGRPTAEQLLWPLIAKEPWRTVWLRIQDISD